MFSLKFEEIVTESQGPVGTLVLREDGQEFARRRTRMFDEDEIIAASDALSGEAGFSRMDMDQAIAEEIEPKRIEWLRAREQPVPAVEDAPEPAVSRYLAVIPGDGAEGPQEFGIRDVVSNKMLTNFVLLIDEEVEIQDDIEPRKEFAGRLISSSRTSPFRISARDFADNNKLKAELFQYGGSGIIIDCGLDELRRAITIISEATGQKRAAQMTTNFGWTVDRTAYLTPAVKISASGIEVLDAKTEVRVELSNEPPACHLNMQKLADEELKPVKRHIVDDLLKLNDPIVTHTLLGSSAAAVLYPFANGPGRFATWMVGRTGAGKKLLAKLFMNFFGDFPVSSGRFSTWSATPYYVQRAGYFFKDALYLADDYKPEILKNNSQMLSVLQTYADNTSRARLRSDATANVQRPIRGLLICTGEDIPDHNASATARSIIVNVPQAGKNVDAGNRCVMECKHYSGVMADFIRWLLAEERTKIFEKRFLELQQQFNNDVAGQQNDIRIASNLALLGAGFELFAEYLGDVWEGWQEAARKFVEVDLIAIRTSMLGEAKDQQASEVFCQTLSNLIQFKHVRVDGLGSTNDGDSKVLIGQLSRMNSSLRPPTVTKRDWLEISMQLALAEVNKHLRERGSPELKVTPRTLLRQLREDGKLLGADGQVIVDPKAESTYRTSRSSNLGQVNVFGISRQVLLGD